MINPNEPMVRNALEIVQTANIARSMEIVNSIQSQNSIIQGSIMSMGHSNVTAEEKDDYIGKIFDASIIINDLVNCLNKLVGDFTGANKEQPKYEWKSLK